MSKCIVLSILDFLQFRLMCHLCIKQAVTIYILLILDFLRIRKLCQSLLVLCLNGCHNLVIRGILCCLLCLTARNYLLIVVTLVMLGEIALCIGNKL